MWAAAIAAVVLLVGAAPSASEEDSVGPADAPVVAEVLGTKIRTNNAQEMRDVIVEKLTDRYAREKHIDATPAEIDAFLAAVDAVEDPEQAPAPRAADAQAADREIAAAFVRQWKLDRMLYQQYGGRIVDQEGSPGPIDAYRSFLEAEQKSGSFQITNEGFEKSFWHYYFLDSIRTFYPSGSEQEKQALEKPWWVNPKAAP